MFDLIDMLIVRPIVNILFVLYNFVGDFGLAIIIFVIVVKLLTWPLMKRQIQQTKLMRKIQPELAEIKKNCKGNRQLESIQMMDLYKRNNIKPFRSLASVFIQLPIFIALFTAINVTVRPREADYNVEHSAYSFVEPMDKIGEVISLQKKYFEEVKDNNEATYDFQPKLFNTVDLSVTPNQVFSAPSLSTVVIFICALGSAAMQFVMSRQQDPTRQKGKKRRTMKDLMREAAEGKEADQAEINAIAQSQMTFMMPLMMLFIMINLPGAIVFYYLLNNIITVFLQKVLLARKLEEMETSADKKVLKELRDATKKIQEAEIVEDNTNVASKNKSTHYAADNKDKKEKVHITRIKASDKKKRR